MRGAAVRAWGTTEPAARVGSNDHWATSPPRLARGRLDVAKADRGIDLEVVLAGVHGGPTYDLSPNDTLDVQAEPIPVPITPSTAREHFVQPSAATPIEMVRLLEASLRRAGVPAAAYPAPTGIRLRARGRARMRATGGELRPRLDLAARSRADARVVEDGVGTSFDLDLDGLLNLEVIGHSDHAVQGRSRPTWTAARPVATGRCGCPTTHGVTSACCVAGWSRPGR